jgi:ubiquinone/menaquinone biosynthesis C-methylase UbiE
MSAITAPFEAFAVRALRNVPAVAQTRLKEWKELRYWKKKRAQEIDLTNSHYAYFYTECFGLGLDDYRGHKLLDVGCGPRGSLEWATTAAEAVGVDPLADRYRSLQTHKQRMTYVNAYAEDMPFVDGHFDDVFCFNALDHTADFRSALEEIQRVLKPGGRFLLITEVNHPPTLAEPNCILPNELSALLGNHYNALNQQIVRVRDDHNVYQSIRDGNMVDAAALPFGEPGIFIAHLIKRGT